MLNLKAEPALDECVMNLSRAIYRDALPPPYREAVRQIIDYTLLTHPDFPIDPVCHFEIPETLVVLYDYGPWVCVARRDAAAYPHSFRRNGKTYIWESEWALECLDSGKHYYGKALYIAEPPG